MAERLLHWLLPLLIACCGCAERVVRCECACTAPAWAPLPLLPWDGPRIILPTSTCPWAQPWMCSTSSLQVVPL